MSRVPLGLVSVALCLALSGCAGLATGAAEQQQPRQPAKGAQAAERARAVPTPEPTPSPLQVADLLGQDGRLTVLILGSDLRKGIPGERTDAIIVATIDPASGEVAMVSLPRDTVNVPIAPGKVYSGRINALLGDYQRSSGKKKVALKKLRETLGYAFDIEIDYYAMVDFSGLVRLVDSIGGVQVTLDDPFIDPTMHLSSKGLRLKAGTQLLSGKEALAYTRSRHTSDDYDRSRRQHQVIVAAANQVRKLGLSALPALLELVRKKVITDMPLRAAPALLELAGKADLSKPRTVILEPVRWARELPGTYTIAPRVLEIQKLFDRLIG